MSALIPYLPDTFRLTYKWWTNVLKADDGTESRICLAQLPDVALEVSYSFDDAIVSYLRHLRLDLFTGLLGTYEIPFRHEAVPALALGATTVDVDADAFADHAIVGKRVFLEHKDGSTTTECFAATISAISTPSAGVTRLTVGTTGAAYPLATTTVSPLHTIQPLDNQGMGRYRGEAAGQRAGVWMLNGRRSDHYEEGTSRSPSTIDGHYLLMFRPRQEDEVAGEEFQAGLEFSDLGLAFSVDTGRTYADTLREHVYFCPDLTEWNQWKEFLYRVYGQQVAFLTPTWREDLVFSQTPAATDTSIFVEYGDNPDFRTWWAAESHKYLMVMWTDGTNEPVRVDAITDGGGELQLDIYPALTGTGTATVCFLELTRLASDEVVVDVMAQGCDVSLGLQVVQSWANYAWPKTAAAMRLAMGSVGTWSYAWDCDDVLIGLGGITPRFGSTRLYDAGGADYRVAGAFPGDTAVRLDGVEEGFGPASNTFLDLDATTSLGEFISFTTNGSAVAGQALISKGTATTYRKLVVANTSGHLTLSVRSGGGSVVSTTLAFDHFDGEPHQVLAIIDRTGQRIQLFSDLGTSTATDITAVGTLVASGQPWSFGVNFDIPLDAAPLDVHYVAIATADIVNLRAAGAAAIAAIRSGIGLQ